MTRAPTLLPALLLLLSAARGQDDPKPAGPAPRKPAPRPDLELVVPVLPAPAVDGDLADESWGRAARFELLRNEEVYGRGRVLRSGRDLFFAIETDLNPRELGIRLNFQQPVSKLSALVLASPLLPPRPPLALFRRPAGRGLERRSARHCDIRFDFDRDIGFAMELEVPLDSLEVPRNDTPLRFSCEIWDVGGERDRPIAVYPSNVSAVAGGDYARLSPAGDGWGRDAPVIPELPVQPALHLMERIEAERGGGRIGDVEPKPILFSHMGWKDGRRDDGALRAVRADLEAMRERYPGYASLNAHLMWVHLARNEFEAALAAQDAIAKTNPAMGRSRGYILIRAELLRSMGRYEQAAEELAAEEELLESSATAREELARLRALAATSALEGRMRAADAKRGDLPRVRVETPEGAFVLELFEDDAPNAVANFVTLVEEGFYDGTRFHWAEGGRHVVGGDPNSRNDDEHDDGFGGPGYRIEPEPGRRLHHRYTITYVDVRGESFGEGSQFMIHIAPLPGLDGRNTVFGRVVEGFEVVNALEYGDRLEKASVLRKRRHAYDVTKR